MKYIQIAAYQLVLMLLISFFAPLTHAASAPQFDHIVFFGDSLSDNGNLYSSSFGFLPKSPPYYKGHFSNGKVWSEYVTDYYTEQKNITSDNYAVGGETAVLHNPIGGYLPFTIGASIDDYLIRTRYTDRSKTLFVIWIGANDYLPSITDADAQTTQVIENTHDAILKLMAHGGVNFLVNNLPDMAKSPYSVVNNMGPQLEEATQLHNSKLAVMVNNLQNAYSSVTIHLLDVNTLLNNMIESNQFKDTTTACWGGAYRMTKNAQSPNGLIQNDINEFMRTHGKLTSNVSSTTRAMSGFGAYIEQNPSLLESYNVGKLEEDGIQPCSNPDDHLFWDHIHPTTGVHKTLAADAIAFINTYETAVSPVNPVSK